MVGDNFAVISIPQSIAIGCGFDYPQSAATWLSLDAIRLINEQGNSGRPNERNGVETQGNSMRSNRRFIPGAADTKDCIRNAGHDLLKLCLERGDGKRRRPTGQRG